MNKSIFNSTDNSEIIRRINQLTPETQAQWGKMNVSQMLYHCTRPLQAATGELKVKRGLVSFLFGKMAKKKFTGEAMFSKSLPTDKRFIAGDTPHFEEEKQRLIAILTRFLQTGKTIISDEPHPFFGKLTADEWDIIQTKHLDHHLNQFGV
jgi:Leu/Phe-tRNA-protein transferase